MLTPVTAVGIATGGSLASASNQVPWELGTLVLREHLVPWGCRNKNPLSMMQEGLFY